MHDMEICDASREDVPTLVDLYAGSGLNEPEENDLDKALAAWDTMKQQLPGARVLMAKRCDGTVLGTVTLLVLPTLARGGTTSARVEDLAVLSATQRGGIGRELMNAALTIAREAGCATLTLSSHVDQEDAHAFFEALGFERQGVGFVAALAGTPQAA